MAALTSARAALDRAETGQRDQNVVWYHRTIAANIEARFLLRSGTDPTSAIAVGRAALAEATRLVPPSAHLLVEEARLDLTEARWAAHERRSPMLALGKARDAAERAVALDPGLASARCAAADVYLQLATTAPSRAARERGLQLIDEALQLDRQLSACKAIGAALKQLPSL